MIDDFALGLTMLLMALACLRLLARPDLDREPEGDAEPTNDNSPGRGPRGRRVHELKLPGQGNVRA